jgi:hypothetical protein
MYFIIKKFLFVFCCVMREKWSFFFALLFFSLLSVCSFLKTSHPFSSEKNSRITLSSKVSLSLSFSLLCFFSRERVLCASKRRERDFYLCLLCVLLLLLLCVGKRNRDTIDSGLKRNVFIFIIFERAIYIQK